MSILLTACRVPLTAEELCARACDAHPTEGRWETQGSKIELRSGPDQE